MQTDYLNVDTLLGKTNWVDYSDGSGIYDIEQFVDLTDEQVENLEPVLELSFCNVHAEDNKFFARVGLAGRLGEVTYDSEGFDTFEEAARAAVFNLNRDYIDPMGSYHGVDALR